MKRMNLIVYGLMATGWCVGVSQWLGCSTVGPLIDNLPALTNAIPEPGAGGPAAVAKDSIDMSLVVESVDTRVDPTKWPVTQALKADLGGHLVLTTEATKVWKDGGGDVCANLHFIVKRNGKWQSYCYDYVRPGQTKKEDLPRAPCKPGQNYETVSKTEECHLYISGLCRDHRRNVSERSNTVCVQKAKGE